MSNAVEAASKIWLPEASFSPDEKLLAVDLFPIGDRNYFYCLAGIVNDIEDTIIADSHSHPLAAVKFLGIARERIILQREKGAMILSCIFGGSSSSSFSADLLRKTVYGIANASSACRKDIDPRGVMAPCGAAQ